MKNKPNPIDKMKTINFKTVILAVLLFSLLLFSLLLFSLAGGVNNLQAQERKTGWFVEVNPYAMDINLKKTNKQSKGYAISYDATVPNFYLNATHTAKFDVSGNDELAGVNAAMADAIFLCQNGEIPIPATVSTSIPPNISLGQYDEITSTMDDLRQILAGTQYTRAEEADIPSCKAFFEAALPPSAATPAREEESSKTQSLKGTGIQFGYNFEKYSLSFNQLQWSGGEDKLQAQVLFVHYFLPYALSVGGGFASAKLDTELGSDSGTALAFRFSYDYPITKNFQIQLGYFWLGVNLAVQDQDTQFTPSSSYQKRRVILGLSRQSSSENNNYGALQGTISGGEAVDTRIVVTATIPTGTEEETIIQSAEIKNPSAVYFGFRYSF